MPSPSLTVRKGCVWVYELTRDPSNRAFLERTGDWNPLSYFEMTGIISAFMTILVYLNVFELSSLVWLCDGTGLKGGKEPWEKCAGLREQIIHLWQAALGIYKESDDFVGL